MHTEIVLTFPNTHSALGGEKALIEAGVTVRVMPRPSALGEGCGICLRIDREDRAKAEIVLRSGGIGVEALFLRERGPGGALYRRL